MWQLNQKLNAESLILNPDKMHRQKLLNLLENHSPFDENEAKMLAETIDFVKNNKNCFERELLIGHVTGSAWILDKSRSHVLLTHHRKLDKWFQPGGHCDGDSDVLQVALKEAKEETGYENFKIISKNTFDVDVHLIPQRKNIPAHFHYDIRFLLEADRNLPFTVSEESNDLAWVLLENVAELNDSESILRMVRKTLKLS